MKNETFAPLVSIVIPVYNGANYMREAIDSALAQTYKNKEIIVVNDGSSDNGQTERIAKEYGDKIRYICKENGGVSTALNTGIKNMKGEYFSWLSHDDVYMPDKIEKQVKALSKLEDKTTLVCCNYVHIDKDSNLIGSMPNVELEDVKLLSWEQMLLDLFRSGPVNGCALLIKKTVFDEVGLFDESLRFYQDGFMWYKIFMAKYAVLSIPDICVKGRIHGKQLTQTGQSLFRKDCEAMSYIMIPQLSNVSTAEHNFLMAYIKYNAKYGNANIVKTACTQAKKTELISIKDSAVINLLSVYAIIRPAIRRIYYTVGRGINTV
ncbi:MAG: glycosyltransferase [Roseburia sp.]|nr:glycosyltransferase [Roseburia sp.]